MNAVGSWNYTIDDSSSLLRYTPYGDGPQSGGWQAWYSVAGFNTACGEESVGDSLHLTTFPGASVFLEFSGTAVTLFGNSNASYQVVLDSSSTLYPASSGAVLFSSQGLNPGRHTVNLTAQPAPGEQLSLDQAIVTTILPSGALGKEPIPLKLDNLNTTALQYSGSWSTQSDPQVPSRASPEAFHVTTTFGASVATNFTSAVAVSINGSRNCGHSFYNVSLIDSDIGLPVTSLRLDANTSWLIGDATLFYWGGLDYTKTYNLSLIDTGPNGQKLTLNYITLYKPNTTDASPPELGTSAHSSKTGEIIGPVVAGVVLVIILVSLLIMRRRRFHKRPPSISPITPYTTQPGSSANILLSSGREKNREPVDADPPSVPTILASSTASGSRLNQNTAEGSSSQNENIAPLLSPAQPAPRATEFVDVDQIVALIAERIDRHDPSPPHASVPPPYAYNNS